MPGNRTLIPRTSPFKSSPKGAGKGAGVASTPASKITSNTHLNAPIPLRGTGKPASTRYTSDKNTSLSSPARSLSIGPTPNRSQSSSAASTPMSTDPSQRSRIPAPFRGRGGSVGLGLAFALPTPKAEARQQLPSGRFHVPLVHSPASKSMPSSADASNRNMSTSNNVTREQPVQAPLVSEEPLGIGHEAASNVLRTPTIGSDASSVSEYTMQSEVESAGGLGEQRENIDMNDDDDEKDNNSHQNGETDVGGNGVDGEDEDVLLSPGFDMIQTLVDTDVRRHSNTLLQSSDLPRPFSRDAAGVLTFSSPPLAPHHTFSSDGPGSAGASKIRSREPSATSPHTIPSCRDRASSTPQTPSQQTPKTLTAILQELEALVGSNSLDVGAVMDAHRETFIGSGSADPSSPSAASPGAVFGAPLAATAHYASCSSVLGGQSHSLPLIVFACVEELYRAGLRSPRLLRPPRPPPQAVNANPSFPSLVAAFNSPPTYGDDVDLAAAALDDVSALLVTYLDCLPGTIIPAYARRPLIEHCVRGGVNEEDGNSKNSTAGFEGDKAVRVGQLILRLLPAAHFSLLVYLLAFLSQIPLHERWNEWSMRDVASAFARVVVGVGGEGDRNTTRKGKGKTKDADADWIVEEEEAVKTLEWLLHNWDDLSDGLFAVVEAESDSCSHRKSRVERKPPRVLGGDVQEKYSMQGKKEMHRATAMSHLDPARDPIRHSHYIINSERAGSHPGATINNAYTQALLARIDELECANAEWQWMQDQHEAELRAMFDEGERRIVLSEEARVAAEKAMLVEKAAVEEAIMAERRRWVGEVQALREGCERLGKAWDTVSSERENVDRLVRSIVGRFAKGAPRKQ